MNVVGETEALSLSGLETQDHTAELGFKPG